MLSGVAKWFRVLGLMRSGALWFKSSTLLLPGFALGSPEFNSSTMFCNKPTGQLVNQLIN